MGVVAEAFAIARGRPLAARQINGPALSWSPAGGLVLAPGEASFERSAAALRCVLLIVQNLAALDLVTLVNGEPDERDPIARLWNAGTPGMPYSARIAREVIMARAELTGEAFAYLPRDGAGRGEPQGIYPIFGRVEVRRLEGDDPLTAKPAGFIVHTGSTTVPLLPDEVLWLRYPHPFNPWGSLAPWRAALGAVESDALAAKWQRNEFRNAARPSAVIHMGDLTEQQHEAAVASYNSRVAGPDNAGKSLLVSGAGKPAVMRLGLTPTEMAFIESRTAHADEVMMALGVNPDLLRAGSTYENRAAAKTALWSDVLLPKCDTVSSEVDRQLQPDPGRVTGFDLSHVDALRESVDAVYRRAVAAVEADLATIDEARAMVELEPLPGGAGAVTITPYRASSTSPPPVRRALPSTAPRLIRAGGTTLTVRPRARRPVDGPEAVLSAYDRHERVGVKAVAALARRQEKAVIQALRNRERKGQPPPQPPAAAVRSEPTGWVDETGERTLLLPAPPYHGRMAADDLFDLQFWDAETIKALDGFMTGTWAEGGHTAARRLGISFDLFDERVLGAMAARLDVLAHKVTATTRAIIEGQLLAAGVEGGESIPSLVKRMQTVFTDLSTWRGTMIARTETVGGFNAASHEVAVASGLVVSRQWLATDDARTRPSHVRLDGERVQGTHSIYSNGLRHPGDPTGPPAETIQCRCVELFDVE